MRLLSPTLCLFGCLALSVMSSAAPLVGSSAVEAPDCQQWFALQQSALDQQQISDAGSTRLDGLPHLRVNRWLAFLHQQANDQAEQQLWLELAASEAQRGWQAELTRLYGNPQQPWRDQLEFCIRSMTKLSSFHGVPEPQVADSYVTWQRIVGIYPLSRLLALPAIKRHQRDMDKRFRHPARLPIRHYLPPHFSGNLPIPSALARNAFDLPLPKGPNRDALLAHYAPVLSIADPKDLNQLGSIVFVDGQPSVDISAPAVYQWLSWTHYRGHALLQLNYQFWFSRRPAAGLLNLHGGELDSLIWRATLKPDGNVLFYDSIHGNGSEHKIFTVARGLRAVALAGDQPTLYPQPVANAASERISLLLEADTHYLVRVEPFSPEGEQQHYQQLEADLLRALPNGAGGYSSLFDQHGLVVSSKRRQRLLRWPLGIASNGAMRQSGQHATALIGRRHFDDPLLAEVLFGK